MVGFEKLFEMLLGKRFSVVPKAWMVVLQSFVEAKLFGFSLYSPGPGASDTLKTFSGRFDALNAAVLVFNFSSSYVL